MPAGTFSKPMWLKYACDEEKLGVKEVSGRAKNNPRVLEYLATAKHLATAKDTTSFTKEDGTKGKKETGSE
jgi:hypothetical protein